MDGKAKARWVNRRIVVLRRQSGGSQGESRVLGHDTPKNTPPERPGTPDKAVAKVQSKDRDMGAALRSVYQKTVDEVIPDDLLDLLGKLG